MIDHDQLAAELRQAERTARPVELLTARFPDLTWADARAVARRTDRLRLADGDQQIGYKLGWTSAQMRLALGIDKPNWGTLWASQILEGHTVKGRVLDRKDREHEDREHKILEHKTRIHPKVEPELVYRSKQDIVGPVSAAEINAEGEWALGLEIVDPRFPSFEFDWLDNTADNSSSGAVAVGEFVALQAAPADVQVTFGNGTEERHGAGANAMGDPGAAVAWLVESLAAEGSIVKAGDIVFTGGLTAPFDVVVGDVFSVESAALPSVVLSTT